MLIRKMSHTVYAANGKVSYIHGVCANEIMPSINHSFVYKAKEGGDAIICSSRCIYI